MINQWQFFHSLDDVKNFIAKLVILTEKLELINQDINNWEFPCLAKFLSPNSTYDIIYLNHRYDKDIDREIQQHTNLLLEYAVVKIKREITTDASDCAGTIMPIGSRAIIVDIIEPWKEFVIEFQIPEPKLVTDYRYETALAKIEDLEFVND